MSNPPRNRTKIFSDKWQYRHNAALVAEEQRNSMPSVSESADKAGVPMTPVKSNKDKP
jgi:hypothetical protein